MGDMEVAGRLVVLLALLFAGTGLRIGGVLDAGRTAGLKALAYYVALPALVFVSTYDQSIGGDTPFASMNVFVTTLVSIATLSMLVVLVG
ncbi:Malonate transporter [Natrarchaeobaculum sulfurireducens]|uniref:Malonate transporter n=2 Tax=Natrarchaeobaculum sulfurireducens TaxID=2044521 RepID=A0A346PL02_9EURY|nr:Malonate transporter [Natrarchaeobaculum sulfurireducens]